MVSWFLFLGTFLRKSAEQLFQGLTAVAHPDLERDSNIHHRLRQSSGQLEAASRHRLLNKVSTTLFAAIMVVRYEQDQDDELEI